MPSVRRPSRAEPGRSAAAIACVASITLRGVTERPRFDLNFRFGGGKAERVARERLQSHLDSLERELEAYRCPLHGEPVALDGGELRACCERAEKDAVALVEGSVRGTPRG